METAARHDVRNLLLNYLPMFRAHLDYYTTGGLQNNVLRVIAMQEGILTFLRAFRNAPTHVPPVAVPIALPGSF